MPLDKKGGFHLHPGAAKMHDSAPSISKPIGKPGGEMEGAPKGHVELHHGPPADGSAPQAKFHTIHHGGSSGGGGGAMGQEHGQMRGHNSLHQAHHAANEHMGGSDSDLHEHTEGGSEPEGGAAEAAPQGADDEY